MNFFWIATAFISLVIAGFVLTRWLIAYSIRNALLDQTNSRSSHKQPTPRIGGLAFVSVISLMLLICSFFGAFELSIKNYLTILLPTTLVASISILDDIKGGISRLIRLVFHFIAAIAIVFFLPDWRADNFLFLICLVFGIVWIINLYNFMDGIDGIAGTEAIFVLLASAGFAFIQGFHQWGLLQLLLTAPIVGFQFFNWQPARIFMGDIGSTYLGTLISCILLIDVSSGLLSLSSGIILIATFVTDASWTLFYRLMTRQKWYHPHRSHTYQILSRKLHSHAKVSLGNMIVNLAWLLPLSHLANRYPAYSYLFVIAALAPLVTLCFFVKAGKLSSN